MKGLSKLIHEINWACAYLYHRFVSVERSIPPHPTFIGGFEVADRRHCHITVADATTATKKYRIVVNVTLYGRGGNILCSPFRDKSFFDSRINNHAISPDFCESFDCAYWFTTIKSLFDLQNSFNMKLSLIVSAFLLGATTALPELVERATCHGSCRLDSDCLRDGGSVSTGLCPDQPEHIRCCSFDGQCGTKGTGTCKFTSDGCSGTWQPGFCPGGSNYKCCNWSISPAENTGMWPYPIR